MTNPVFKAYMTTQQDAYVDSWKDFTEDRLTEVALNKYKILIESDKWNVPSDQDTKIIVLSAEIYELKMRDIQSRKEKKAGVNNKNKSGIEWKKIPPAVDKPTKKTVGNITYNWCVHHKYWTIHTSDDFWGIKGAPCKTTTSSKKESNNKILQATNALVSLMSEDKETE